MSNDSDGLTAFQFIMGSPMPRQTMAGENRGVSITMRA
jgi:hypothetical protein